MAIRQAFGCHRTSRATDGRRAPLRRTSGKEQDRGTDTGAHTRETQQWDRPDHLSTSVLQCGQTVRQTQTTNSPTPRPHVSAERPECQYGVVFTYRYTQNSHLNTSGSKNTCIQKHFRHIRTHSSVLSSRTASMSDRGKTSRTPAAKERMRAYSLNYSSSSPKSVLCSQILVLAPFPADKQLSFPHPMAPHPRLVLPGPTHSVSLIPCTLLGSFCLLPILYVSQPFSLLTSICLHHQL